MEYGSVCIHIFNLESWNIRIKAIWDENNIINNLKSFIRLLLLQILNI